MGGLNAATILPELAEDGLHCSFCGRGQTEVKILIAGAHVFICDECVKSFAQDVAIWEHVPVKGKLIKSGRASVKRKADPAGYKPSENEPYMSQRQMDFFQNRLLEWKDDILREVRYTTSQFHTQTGNHADLADRVSSETDRALELRTRDRQRKLISKIDAALKRIADREYGYCEETGEPIGLARLMARPIATLGLEAQERHERRARGS